MHAQVREQGQVECCAIDVSLAGLWRHPGGCISSAEAGDAGVTNRARALLASGQSPDDPCLYAGGDGCKLCQLENDWDTPLLQVSPDRVCSYAHLLLSCLHLVTHSLQKIQN